MSPTAEQQVNADGDRSASPSPTPASRGRIRSHDYHASTSTSKSPHDQREASRGSLGSMLRTNKSVERDAEPDRARKTVKTVPPFARGEPPSPPTSPRVVPTSAGSSHPISPALHPLQPASTFDTDTIASSADTPAPWWTFVWPKVARQRQMMVAPGQEGYGFTTSPGSRWRDPVAVPLEERERRRDYFASGSGDDVPPNSATATPGPGPSSSKISRLKALTLPISRRASSEEPAQRRTTTSQAEAPQRRSLTLDPPFHFGTPSRRPSMPAALSEEPESLELPPVEQQRPSVPPARSSHSVSWSALVAAAQKAATASATHLTNPPQTPPSRLHQRIPEEVMHVAIPPSAFVPPVLHDGVPGMPATGQWRREGQAPPTPDGWDNVYANSDMGQHRTRARHLAAEPWNEPFEEAAEYDLDAGATNESGGTTAVNSGHDRDRSLDGEPGRKPKRSRQIRDMLRMDRGLRQRRLQEAMGTPRQRVRKFILANPFVTGGLRTFNLACVVTVLGLAISIRHYEHVVQVPGLIGPSPILAIAYASLTTLHVSVALWLEWFGRPIGLWRLRAKMFWVCLDLLFISLWSSDLSLCISDYIATPLTCTTLSPWWSDTPGIELAPDALIDREHDTLCDRQATLITFVALVLVIYTASMVLSLFRIFERIKTVAKAHVKGAHSY